MITLISKKDKIKIILRHADLSTIQRSLGKVNDSVAIGWIEKLYGKRKIGGRISMASSHAAVAPRFLHFGAIVVM